MAKNSSNASNLVALDNASKALRAAKEAAIKAQAAARKAAETLGPRGRDQGLPRAARGLTPGPFGVRTWRGRPARLSAPTEGAKDRALRTPQVPTLGPLHVRDSTGERMSDHTIGRIQTSLATDGRGATPDPDPEQPRENPHTSHAWVLTTRWAYCASCGARDHWPGAEAACKGKARRAGADPDVRLSDALRALMDDVVLFGDWWAARIHTLGGARPTMEEWHAEFHAWLRDPGAERKER